MDSIDYILSQLAKDYPDYFSLDDSTFYGLVRLDLIRATIPSSRMADQAFIEGADTFAATIARMKDSSLRSRVACTRPMPPRSVKRGVLPRLQDPFCSGWGWARLTLRAWARVPIARQELITLESVAAALGVDL